MNFSNPKPYISLIIPHITPIYPFITPVVALNPTSERRSPTKELAGVDDVEQLTRNREVELSSRYPILGYY